MSRTAIIRGFKWKPNKYKKKGGAFHLFLEQHVLQPKIWFMELWEKTFADETMWWLYHNISFANPVFSSYKIHKKLLCVCIFGHLCFAHYSSLCGYSRVFWVFCISLCGCQGVVMQLLRCFECFVSHWCCYAVAKVLWVFWISLCGCQGVVIRCFECFVARYVVARVLLICISLYGCQGVVMQLWRCFWVFCISLCYC